jgi:integrase
VRLGYRRNTVGGRWNVIASNGRGGSWLKAFADADDHQEANGETVMDFWQASARARILARGEDGSNVSSDSAPGTVAEAVDAYEADLETRGGDVNNAKRVRIHLPDAMRHKAVALLTARELRHWRDVLAKKLSAASVNRIGNSLRASLNLATDTDARIVNRSAWEVGLQAIPDVVETRNVILADNTIRRIVTEAYGISEQFGLLTEVAATTGSRVSQLARLEVADLQGGRGVDIRLMMPSAKKGKGAKKISHKPVPIPAALAARLKQAAEGRSKHDRLLLKPSGAPWAQSDHTRLFARAAKRAGCDPAEVTIYALRHSSIVRQLLANIPIRVVAIGHDTSTAMIEKTYSKNIGDHSDALVRPALLDLSKPPPVPNVVALGRRP